MPALTPRKVYTKDDNIHAGDDAVRLLKEAKSVEVFFSTMVLALHLYSLSRGMIQHEIQEGWEVVNPELVLERLTGKAFELSQRPTDLVDLQLGFLTTVVPALDAMIVQQLEEPSEDSPAEGEQVQETAHAE